MNHSTALFERTVARGVKVSAVLRPSHPATLNDEYGLRLRDKKLLQAKLREFYAFNRGTGK